MDPQISIPKGRIVDLTHVLLPGKEQYTLEVSRKNLREGREGDIMCTMYMWSHVGTHIEAPLHFLADGGDTASIPVEMMIGPAIVLDFRDKGVSEPITLAEMQAAGDIQVGDRVLTMTGRHTSYRTPQSHDRPYITEEAMRWLVEDRKINCLGTDSSGFEVRGVTNYPNHRLLTEAGIPVIECMNNLVELKQAACASDCPAHPDRRAGRLPDPRHRRRTGGLTCADSERYRLSHRRGALQRRPRPSGRRGGAAGGSGRRLHPPGRVRRPFRLRPGLPAAHHRRAARADGAALRGASGRGGSAALRARAVSTPART